MIAKSCCTGPVESGNMPSIKYWELIADKVSDVFSCGVRLANYLFMSAYINLDIYNASGFDPGAPRWKRMLWVLVSSVFFQNPIPKVSRFRAALLRAFGARVGKGVIFGRNVYISFPWRLAVGDHVWIGDDVGILSMGQVTIESNVCVARRCYLSTASHDFRRKDFKLKVAPILIRQGSWIAIGSLVVAGVTIGEGVVVSAGSVVLRDVPANCLVRGNPAQIVREIFRDPGGAEAAIGVSRPHVSGESTSPRSATARAVA
jgi:putative colanic acid biosynthesis acetyltransferase WcaF